jgi:peptidoglycan/LPS O-acetylase OafA/YrhL
LPHLAAVQEESSARVWYPALDGIRAVAVTLVFAVHYTTHCYFGWAGVLVFFVLSGFLITGVLFDNRYEPRRFQNFYVRRTLRIFPLFYFIWALVFLCAPILHEQWSPIRVLWPTYLGNFARFIAGNSAVDHIYTKIPWFPIEIGHFWSLAVEEQFYLLWPLVVFKIADRRALIQICAIVILAVLALRTGLLFILPHHFLQLDFYFRMMFLQADAFLVGGLIALLMRGPERESILRFASPFFWTTLALLFLTCALNRPGAHLSGIVPSRPWMSSYGFTLISLVSGGMILCAMRPGNLVFRILALRPLRVLGKYSYGFYVYHVLLLPLRVFHLRPHQPAMVALLLLLADFLVVLAISALSYHFLESPFLRLKSRFAVQHKA